MVAAEAASAGQSASLARKITTNLLLPDTPSGVQWVSLSVPAETVEPVETMDWARSRGMLNLTCILLFTISCNSRLKGCYQLQESRPHLTL